MQLKPLYFYDNKSAINFAAKKKKLSAQHHKKVHFSLAERVSGIHNLRRFYEQVTGISRDWLLRTWHRLEDNTCIQLVKKSEGVAFEGKVAGIEGKQFNILFDRLCGLGPRFPFISEARRTNRYRITDPSKVVTLDDLTRKAEGGRLLPKFELGVFAREPVTNDSKLTEALSGRGEVHTVINVSRGSNPPEPGEPELTEIYQRLIIPPKLNLNPDNPIGSYGLGISETFFVRPNDREIKIIPQSCSFLLLTRSSNGKELIGEPLVYQEPKSRRSK